MKSLPEIVRDNGKDNDGFENVDGNVTAKSTLLGLRVKKVVLEEDDEGGGTAEASIVGVARGLTALVGESVQIVPAAGRRQLLGHVCRVTITEGKDGGPKTVQAKVTAGREIDQLIGIQVQLQKAQGELPGLEANVEEEEGPARLGEPDAPATAPRAKKHRGREARA